MATPKSKIAREVIKTNPKITSKRLAELVGMKEKYASVFLAQERRKERGFPKFIKKPKQVDHAAANEMMRLHGIIDSQQKQILNLQAEVDNLRHQAVGYDAALDFLWHKLQER